MKRNQFTIQDKYTKQPMVNTHYYKWLLQKQPKNIHAINTKIEYLTEQGFKLFEDAITNEELFTLQAVEQHYFHNEIKPILDKKPLGRYVDGGAGFES